MENLNGLEINMFKKNSCFLMNYLKKNIKQLYFLFKEIHLYSILIVVSSDKYLLSIFNHDNIPTLTKYLKTRKKPKFLMLEEGNCLETFQKIVKKADNCLAHKLNIFSDKPQKINDKINWHCDFKTGYCWNPKLFYKKITHSTDTGIDIKIPWELSRFNHLLTLGQAYYVTKQPKYFVEYKNQVLDWIESNPVGYGVNWASTMDVSIRACNLIVSLSFFKNSGFATEKLILKMTKSLLAHLYFIKNNLEKGHGLLKGNHYLSNLIGLAYLSIFFQESKIGQSTLCFVIKQLKSEMKDQILKDGCNFEASTYYHKLVTELFFFSTYVIVINNPNFSNSNFFSTSVNIFGKEYTLKLKKMFDVILALVKPDGKLPQFGDNDSGRLFQFSPSNEQDVTFLLKLGCIFFNDKKYNIPQNIKSNKNIVWLYGLKGCAALQNSIQIPREGDFLFPYGGWHSIKSKNNALLISASPHGQNGRGGHSHNDKLSFELVKNGQNIIIDPGTYTYTSSKKWRNIFRSTEMHNCLKVDNLEQNSFIDTDPFALKKDMTKPLFRYSKDKHISKIQFNLIDYNHLKNFYHKRIFTINKKAFMIEIEDNIKCNYCSSLILEWNFNLNPICYSKVKNKTTHIFSKDHKKILTITTNKKMTLEVKKSYYSPCYGVKIASTRLSYTLKHDFRKENILKKVSFNLN